MTNIPGYTRCLHYIKSDEEYTQILYNFYGLSVSLRLFKSGNSRIIAFYPEVFGEEEFWLPV